MPGVFAAAGHSGKDREEKKKRKEEKTTTGDGARGVSGSARREVGLAYDTVCAWRVLLESVERENGERKKTSIVKTERNIGRTVGRKKDQRIDGRSSKGRRRENGQRED